MVDESKVVHRAVHKKPPLSIQSLRLLVRKALDRPGAIILDDHCRQHMRERHFDANDVLTVFDNGNYHKYKPEYDQKRDDWMFFVVGEDLDGKRLKILFCIEQADIKIRVISGQRFSKGKRV
jgi:hypothetical protein